MTSNALKNFGGTPLSTPQTEKAAKGQKKNSAGGYSFKTSKLDGAKRFLLLGTDSASYLSSEKLTADRAKDLIKLAEVSETHQALVDLIVEYSTEGRVVKQSPGLFALAVATTHGTDSDRYYAYSKLSEVARTASTLFEFISYRLMFGAWSMGLRKAVSRWYLEKTPEQIAYQGVKYRQREGWTHRDVLRSAHGTKTATDEQGNVFDWLTDTPTTGLGLPSVINGYEEAKTAKGKALVSVIEKTRVPWEALPTESLNDKAVWKALFENKSLPLGALIRQLPRLTRLGMFDRMGGGFTEQVIARLTDEQELAKARIHPISILTSHSTYASGRGQGSEWVPNRKIVQALDEAFYKSFKYATPSNKRFMFAIDLSASMTWNKISAQLDSRDVAGALALVALNTEPYTMVTGFTSGGNGSRYHSGLTELDIDKSMRLGDVTSYINRQQAGGTDAALPMLYAEDQKLDVDTFVVVTDNETWAGRIHPHEALQRYRKAMGKPDAQLIVLATTSTRFSIADPKDPNTLDIPGFDAAVPRVISEFARGL